MLYYPMAGIVQAVGQIFTVSPYLDSPSRDFLYRLLTKNRFRPNGVG